VASFQEQQQQMCSMLISIILFVQLIYILSYCIDNDQQTMHEIGDIWIMQTNFNVTCTSNNSIKVINCITDFGQQISLGTINYRENGIDYSCTPSSVEIDGSGDDLLPTTMYTSDQCDNDNIGRISIIDRFQVECTSMATHRIIACVDDGQRIIEHDQLFVESNGQLKMCRVLSDGRRARIENKG
jgi:hypothetical protein